MPNMPHDEWAALSRLLDEALELTDSERGPWLTHLAELAPAMAERVARALAVSAQDGFAEFLAGPSPLPAEEIAMVTLIGRRVGPYVVEAEIGRGGMGSVWRASRADGRYEGTVAIKFVHAAWIGQSGEERFRTEGSLLGRLDHPNIARLLDAGVLEATQPYLVLEYVEGEPIDAYCDRHALSLEARAGLFLNVLAAVAHAHRHLVVHRDIKPDNIFVTREGVVKLLDFGIAKLLDGETGTALTQSSVSALTPQYAAPEQLLGKPVTTATDVYALGLVFYLLLTGTHPVPARSRSSAELVHAVLTEGPAPASAVAKVASIPPRSLEGDLDNILGKALKKVPAERYDSVGAFSEDIRRCLAHQPVQARPDTLRYRAEKFVRRHRGSVLTAALTAISLILTTGTALWQMRQVKHERDVALSEARRADAVGDFMIMLVGNIGNSIAPQALRSQLDHARALIAKQQYDDPLVKANLLRYLAGRYSEYGDPASAVPLLEEALAALQTVDEPVATAQLDCSIANYYDDLGRNDESDRHIRRSMALFAKLGGAVRPQVRADCRVVESYIASSRGENHRAIDAAQTAVSEVEGAGIRSGLQHDTVLNALARAQARAGHNALAVGLLRQLRKSDVAQGRDRTMGGWIHAFNEARDLLAGGRVADAERLSAELLESSRQFDPDGSHARDIELIRGRSLLAIDRVLEAEILLARAANEDEKSPGASLEGRLAHVEARLRQRDAVGARRELDAGRAAVEAAVAERKPEGVMVLRVQALADLSAGHAAAADASLARAAALAVDADGEPTTEFRAIAALRAEGALMRGASSEACGYAEAAMAQGRREAVDVSSSAWIGEALLLHARCNRALGRLDEGRVDARSALTHLEANLGANHPLAAQARALADL